MTASEVMFEMAMYELLRSEPNNNILASRLLYYRLPVRHVGPSDDLPRDIAASLVLVKSRGGE
jgi:hypothetical protein